MPLNGIRFLRLFHILPVRKTRCKEGRVKEEMKAAPAWLGADSLDCVASSSDGCWRPLLLYSRQTGCSPELTHMFRALSTLAGKAMNYSDLT